MKKVFIHSVVFLFFFTQCTTQRFFINQQVERPGRIPQHEFYEHYFFYGLAQKSDYNLKDVCIGRDISFIETNFNGLSFVAFILTYGMYFPKKTSFYCEDKK